MAAATTTVATVLTDQQAIAAFNRGPVISIFTPPASCLSTLTLRSSMYFGHQFGDYYDTACFPSSTLNLGVSAWDLYYYSPAQCPLGWYQATQFSSTFSGFHPTILSLGSSTTAVLCCPSGYFYAISDFGSGAGHQCQSAFTSTSSTLLYISPVLNDNAWYSTDGASTTTATASPVYNIYGDGIPVWWQSSDLAAFAAATGQPTTPTNSPTSSSRTATSSTPSSTPPARTNGLSSGAKIGIGVGIPIVVIALGILAFIWFKRSRHRKSIVHPEGESAAVDKYPQEVPADGPIRQELYSDSDPYQYGQARRRAELPGPEQGGGA